MNTEKNSQFYVLNILNIIGFNGPIILLIISVILLYSYKMYTLLIIYIIGFLLNSVLNFILKGIFRHPRPLDDRKVFLITPINENRIGFDKYGMPSGHAQHMLYSTIFIFFALKNVLITTIFIILSILTICQRVINKSHFIYQVIMGSLIGALMGYGTFSFAQTNLKGSLKMKHYDNVF